MDIDFLGWAFFKNTLKYFFPADLVDRSSFLDFSPGGASLNAGCLDPQITVDDTLNKNLINTSEELNYPF